MLFGLIWSILASLYQAVTCFQGLYASTLDPKKKLLLLTSIFVGDNQMLKANHFSEKDKCHWENNRDIQIQARDCMDG